MKVDESVAVFGVFLRIFGKAVHGHYPGHDYEEYMNWIDQACDVADDLIQADPLLKQFVEDTKSEIKTAKQDYLLLKSVIDGRGWTLEQPYDLAMMKRTLYTVAGISDHSRRNIWNRYFDRVVRQRQAEGRSVSLSYVLTRSTSLDWNLLDLFYRLCTFDHFKAMFDKASRKDKRDEGPICNLSLISQYLARFMDLYRPVISADILLEDRYRNWLFGSFLYALFRLGESEYENPEDPFPKGRIPFLTIHQAKGLEFPVVVFGNPNKSRRGVQKVEEIVHPLIDRQGEPLDKIPDGGSLFGIRDPFDLSTQLHAPYCSTNVLGHPALIRFLLTFLDISLDGFRTDLSSRTNAIALRPQWCVSAPIRVADTFKLFSQPVRTNPFEQTNDFGRRKLRRWAHKQVYMVGHDLNCQYLQPVLCGDFRQQLFLSRLNRPNQDLFTIARYPNQMVFDCIRAVRGVVGFAWHRYILAKEGGFLHPLKRAGFRRQGL